MSEPVPNPVAEATPYLTVTRLRLRWTRPLVLTQFLRLSLKNARAARSSRGFITGALWVDARLAFWTVTLWQSEASMRAYARGPVHIGAMQHLRKHRNAYTEAAFASGLSPVPQLPTKAESHAFLTAQATFYELPNPSADHAARRVRSPNVRSVQRLRAAPHQSAAAMSGIFTGSFLLVTPFWLPTFCPIGTSWCRSWCRSCAHQPHLLFYI
jgi:heme-degrading monooxygenase HmoA